MILFYIMSLRKSGKSGKNFQWMFKKIIVAKNNMKHWMTIL